MAEATKSKEPKDSRFVQQKLSAFRPVLTPIKVIMTYLIVGGILIPIGSVCLSASRQVDEVSYRYDNDRNCLPSGETHEDRVEAMQNPERNATCRIFLTVTRNMTPPIYVYYELEDYFQNHRRYVKSRSDDQLIGESGGSLSDCKPKLYQDAGNNTQSIINPCGLTAWSFFNDTFKIDRMGPDGLSMIEEGIAWKSDIDYKFGDQLPENFNNIPASRGGGQINGTLSNDEHFVVWMRTAMLPTFRKLYGIIDDALIDGDLLSVIIENRYNTYLFGGRKRIVFSTTSWLGGKNHFLGFLYIAMGCLCIFVGCTYFLLHVQFPRDMGDERFLSWKRKYR